MDRLISVEHIIYRKVWFRNNDSGNNTNRVSLHTQVHHILNT